jgi:hypothetical protein
MERITGPYKGYFIAAYTVEGGQSFVGYAKICLTEPTSVWDATNVEKLTSATGYRTEQEAITAAERKARHAIADMVGDWDQVSTPGALE